MQPFLITTLIQLNNNQPTYLNDFVYGIQHINDTIKPTNKWQVLPFVIFYNNINLIKQHTHYKHFLSEIDSDYIEEVNKFVFLYRNHYIVNKPDDLFMFAITEDLNNYHELYLKYKDVIKDLNILSDFFTLTQNKWQDDCKTLSMIFRMN